MDRFSQLADELTNDNEAHLEPRAKKSRSDDKSIILNQRTPNIATLDNGTMVQVFKFLNYFGLAKNSLVCKRFCTLIQTHRHLLARCYVYSIAMRNLHYHPDFLKVFNKVLTTNAYNDWVIKSQYSKQIPTETQIAWKNTQDDHKVYVLSAFAGIFKSKNVFFASVKLHPENWPLFQHFFRLLTDPFIYIRSLELTPQFDVSNLLAGEMNLDGYRLQCKELTFYLEGNVQKFVNWVKVHVLCEKVDIYDYSYSKYDKVLYDLFVSGAHCTSEVCVKRYELSWKCIVDLVQKFINLKSNDECHIVKSIRGNVTSRDNVHQSVDMLKRDCAEFFVKEEKREANGSIEHVLEFINSDIEKNCSSLSKVRYKHTSTNTPQFFR